MPSAYSKQEGETSNGVGRLQGPVLPHHARRRGSCHPCGATARHAAGSRGAPSGASPRATRASQATSPTADQRLAATGRRDEAAPASTVGLTSTPTLSDEPSPTAAPRAQRACVWVSSSHGCETARGPFEHCCGCNPAASTAGCSAAARPPPPRSRAATPEPRVLEAWIDALPEAHVVVPKDRRVCGGISMRPRRACGSANAARPAGRPAGCSRSQPRGARGFRKRPGSPRTNRPTRSLDNSLAAALVGRDRRPNRSCPEWRPTR